MSFVVKALEFPLSEEQVRARRAIGNELVDATIEIHVYTDFSMWQHFYIEADRNETQAAMDLYVYVAHLFYMVSRAGSINQKKKKQVPFGIANKLSRVDTIQHNTTQHTTTQYYYIHVI